MKTCLGTGTKLSKGNGVRETFILAKELQLNPSEVKYKLFLDQEGVGQTAWLLAAKSDKLKLLKELWALTKKEGNPEEIKYNLFLAQNEYGETALHVAAEGIVEVLEKLWAYFQRRPTKRRQVNELLLATDKHVYTDWNRAAEKGSLEALETLCRYTNKAEINPMNCCWPKMR